MRKFYILDTDEIWTEDEIRENYEMYKDESDYMSSFDSFEDYLDEEISFGRSGQGGIKEVTE